MENSAEKLRSLDARVFENLIYDLLFALGLRNLIWRTPGADGGRDLQGEYSQLDYSGETVSERWYVECKRHEQSIGWPTVYEKLSIADNHEADFLLFVTTANFSAACYNEVEKYNRRKRGPRIRIWPFYKLQHLLALHPHILAKYGLSERVSELSEYFVPVIKEAEKFAQAVYARTVFNLRAVDSAELQSSLLELISARVEDISKFGRFVRHRFKPERDSFEWCSPYPLAAQEFDQFSLRAALSAIRLNAGQEQLNCELRENAILVSGNFDCASINESRLISIIVTFGLISLRCEKSTVIIENGALNESDKA